MSQQSASNCPRCGTPIEEPLFGPQRGDVCQACGWGEQRIKKPEGLISSSQLSIYWILSGLLICGSYYTLISIDAGFLAPLVSHKLYFNLGFVSFWILYAGLASVLDFKIDYDNIAWFGGLMIDLGGLCLLIAAGLLFPGRIVSTTVIDSLIYIFRHEKRLD